MAAEEVKNKTTQYYNKALLHITWLVRAHSDPKRLLVFGMMEMYPNEITSILSLPEQGQKFGSDRLFYQRIPMDVEDAVCFYRSIASTGKIPMIWNESGDIVILPDGSSTQDEFKSISCGSMADIKTWPKFVVSKRDDENGRPFIPDSWGVCRIHQIFPKERDPGLMDFISHEKAGKWLEQYLTWNISVYPELVGGMNLILPNPYYRNKHIRMIPGDSRDSVRIDFQRRAGMMDVPDLTLVPFEKSYFGVSGGQKYPVLSDSVTIPLSGRAEDFGCYVVSSEELIDFEFFSGFWKGFDFDIFTGYATKEIHKPGSGKTSIVDVYSHNDTVRMAEESTGLGRRLKDAEILRARKKKITESGFRSFYNDHAGAEKFLQEIIQRAHRSVMIVDPYYSTMELFDYAMHVSVLGMKVTILTSADHLKSKSRIKGVYEKGKEPVIADELNLQIKDYNCENGELRVLVMTGEAAIHDRFLFADDDAWFCGGSFNEAGNRLSCFVKIPDQESIKHQIESIIKSNRVKTFEDWYDMWQKCRMES